MNCDAMNSSININIYAHIEPGLCDKKKKKKKHTKKENSV